MSKNVKKNGIYFFVGFFLLFVMNPLFAVYLIHLLFSFIYAILTSP